MPGPPNIWISLTLVFLGGGLGSVGRYLIAGLDHHLNRGPFPFGTLAVNLLGCGLIGLAFAWIQGGRVPETNQASDREAWRLFLMIGVLGGFTTFSSFGLEAVRLLQDGHHARAIVYVLASNLGGVLLAWGGFSAGSRVFAPSG